ARSAIDRVTRDAQARRAAAGTAQHTSRAGCAEPGNEHSVVPGLRARAPAAPPSRGDAARPTRDRDADLRGAGAGSRRARQRTAERTVGERADGLPAGRDTDPGPARGRGDAF